MSEAGPGIFREGILGGRVAFVNGGGTGITGGVARALAEAGDVRDFAQVERVLARTLERSGRIRDIEQCAVFLCSDAAAFVNGAVIVVDGGHWLGSNRMVGA